MFFPPSAHATGFSLRSKRFRLVSDERKTEERDSRFWPTPRSLLTPFFAQSLTLVPRSLLLNRTETLAKQAKLALIDCASKKLSSIM